MSSAASITKKPPGLFRSTVLYAIGDFVTKGARIILVPYFLASLTPAELGQLAILTAIGFATWTLTAFGLGMTIQRQYFDYGDNADRFVVTVWLGRLVGGLPVLAILLLAGWGYGQLYGDEIPTHLIQLSILAGYLRGGMNLIESWYIAREQPLRYRSFTFFQFLSITALIIYFISVQRLGVSGAIYGEFLGYIIWTVVAAVVLLRSARPSRGLVRWRTVLAYSLPVIPHSFFMWGLSGIDRLILQQQGVPLGDIGVYDVAYQLAMYLSIVTLALRAAWLPKYFKQAAEQPSTESSKPAVGPQFIATCGFYVQCVAVAAMAGWLLAPESFYLLMGRPSESHVQLFRLVLAGNLAMALFQAFNVPILSEKRTEIVAVMSAIGLTANIAINYLLVEHYATYGAAWATVAAYLIMAMLMFLTIQRRYSIAWRLDSVLLVPLLSTTVMFLSYPLMQPWNWGTIVRVALLGGFIGLALLPNLRARRFIGRERNEKHSELTGGFINEVRR